MQGNREGKTKTLSTFTVCTKCREMGKQGEDFRYVSDLH